MHSPIYTGVRDDEIPGYIGVIEQATLFVDGKLNCNEQNKVWMIRGLLLVVDSMRGELVREK